MEHYSAHDSVPGEAGRAERKALQLFSSPVPRFDVVICI